MLDGSCTASADGCFTSPNHPSNYGNGENCTIVVGTDVTMVVQSFSTEADFDVLTVNDVAYSGSGDGLDGLVVRAGAIITWSSDGLVYHEGWQICSGGTIPTPREAFHLHRLLSVEIGPMERRVC